MNRWRVSAWCGNSFSDWYFGDKGKARAKRVELLATLSQDWEITLEEVPDKKCLTV